MRADCGLLRFVNAENKLITKEIRSKNCNCSISNNELLKIKGESITRIIGNLFIVTSHQKMNNIKCFLVINDFSQEEAKNIEMLKVLASQALFAYYYAGHMLD